MPGHTKYMSGPVLSILLLINSTIAGQQQPSGQTDTAGLPHLRKQGAVTQLIVEGKPYLILAGELHNSSTSSIEYMKPIWPKLKQMNLNTVLAVVSWALIEPEEGKFDFTIVDNMIQEAGNHDLHLVILWFGSWKNGISHFPPYWVKKDIDRFPRVRIKNGKHIEVLSPLSKANMDADAHAFAALMRHIREVDSSQQIVIMIQVQNEVGILGDSRDRSDVANEAFTGPVPNELMEYLRKHKDRLLPELKEVWSAGGYKESGTWTEVFGEGARADEIFMAWYYARYIDKVAQAGKAEYPIPMFVNTWLVQRQNEVPGDYPSGGPQARNHNIWRAGAPNIDIFAPDIYVPNFEDVCRLYSRSGNPLFIPESRAGAQGAANAFLAIGKYNAIGYSPFGIDGRLSPGAGFQPMFPGRDGPDTFPQAYDVLSQLAPLILEHQGSPREIDGNSFISQGKDSMTALQLNNQNPTENITMGDYKLEVTLRRQRRSTEVPASGYCIIIMTGPDEYVVAGIDCQITFFTNTPGSQIVGLGSVYEGKYVDGRWIPGRKLNGDAIMLNYHLNQMAEENRPGSVLRLQGEGPVIRQVKLYHF